MVLSGIAVIFCLGLAILWYIYTYNTFRRKQAKIDFWWDEADTHLRLRRDLIPSLVDRARPLMGDETQTLDRIASIREEIIKDEISPHPVLGDCDAELLENRLSAEMLALQSAFKRHVEIQVNESLLTVMSELVSIEGRALSACKEYNKLTYDYNASIKGFPANLVAGMLHFNPREKRVFGSREESSPA